MVIKSIIGATCACLAVVSFNVNAAMISHYGYTLDTNTDIVTGGGLEWLNWGVTDDGDYTVNEVISMYETEGWRLASNEEMVQLLEDFNFMTGFTAIEGNTLDTGLGLLAGDSYLPYLRFFELFGITNVDACPHDSCDTSLAVYGSDEDNDNYVKHATVAIDLIGEDDYGSVTLYRDSQNLDDYYHGSDYESGVALVRISAVPVPAAVWLFGSGLIGLIGLARRKKA